MRKYLALFLAAVLVCGSAYAQPQVDDVYRTLNAGEIASVVKYLDKVVDITINDDQSTYSKSQAEMVLRNFFSRHTILSFAIKHKGNAASDNTTFLIGELRTARGTFRVYLGFKQKDKQFLLKQLKFEQ